MTAPGTVQVPAEVQRGDHACWIYHDRQDLAETVVRFMSEGQRLGERLLLVGSATKAELVDLLADLPDRDQLLATGALQVRPLSDVYASDGTLNPSTQVEVLRSARDAAVAEGATGLRIAAEISDLVRGRPDRERELQTYERDVCAIFNVPELTALCLYDETLGSPVFGPLAVLHPVQHRVGHESSVHLCSSGQGLALRGELDLVDAEDVHAALSGIARTTDHDMDLDLSELTFLDVAGARSLALAAADFRSCGLTLRLVRARPAVRRCLALFDGRRDEA